MSYSCFAHHGIARCRCRIETCCCVPVPVPETSPCCRSFASIGALTCVTNALPRACFYGVRDYVLMCCVFYGSRRVCTNSAKRLGHPAPAATADRQRVPPHRRSSAGRGGKPSEAARTRPRTRAAPMTTTTTTTTTMIRLRPGATGTSTHCPRGAAVWGMQAPRASAAAAVIREQDSMYD